MQKNSAQRAPMPTESVEQQLLFRWARFYVSKYPELVLCCIISPMEVRGENRKRDDLRQRA